MVSTKHFSGHYGTRQTHRLASSQRRPEGTGVKEADVYKVLSTKEGADRAFKKLTELKPNIQWWETGAQPAQFLVAGDVVLSVWARATQVDAIVVAMAGAPS